LIAWIVSATLVTYSWIFTGVEKRL